MVEDIRQRVATRLTDLQKQVRDCEDNLLIHKTQNKTIENTLKVKEAELEKAVQPDFTALLNGLSKSIAEAKQQYEVASAAVVEKEKDYADAKEKTEKTKDFNKQENEEREQREKDFKNKTGQYAEKKEAKQESFLEDQGKNRIVSKNVSNILSKLY